SAGRIPRARRALFRALEPRFSSGLEPQTDFASIGPHMSESFQDRLEAARRTSQQLLGAVGQVIVGQHEVVEQVLWGLVAGGHVLLEGNPGLGKTLLVRTLS